MTKEQWDELFLKVNDMPVEELEKIILDGARKAGIVWYGDKELEELVGELRKESCGAKTTSWWRAADAIEELLPFKKQVEKGMGLLDKADQLLNAIKPRWIPVTERLPDTMEDKSVYSGWSAEIAPSDDVLCYLGSEKRQTVAWYSHTYKEWTTVDENTVYKYGEITHWQPLSEPPKEET